MSAVPCEADPERWYDPALVTLAKRVCAGCPARDNCLTLALDFKEPWGVWGGLTENERIRYAAGKPIIPCKRCGLDFVPANPRATRCDVCCPNDSRADVDEIRRLAADAWTNKQIGELKGWPVWRVQEFRARHNIPSLHLARRGTVVATGSDDLKPCGTTAAYRRHLRRNEPIDEACRQANLRADAEKRARRRLDALVSA